MVGTCGHLGRGRRSHCLPVLGCQFCCALAWSGRRQSLGLSILRTPFLPVGRSTPQLLLPSTQALLQTPWSVYAVRASCALKLFLKILRLPERQFRANDAYGPSLARRPNHLALLHASGMMNIAQRRRRRRVAVDLRQGVRRIDCFREDPGDWDS